MKTRITLTKNQKAMYAALIDAADEWSTAAELGVTDLAGFGLAAKGIAHGRLHGSTQWSLTAAGRFIAQFKGIYR